MNDPFFEAAIREAEAGFAEGGIPIGAVLVIDNEIVGRGHNQRLQQSSATLHAEIACLENAGRLTAKQYTQATLYSTLSPCPMCSGAVLLYSIPKVVIGENQTFQGPEGYLREQGVNVAVRHDARCKELMAAFIKTHPDVWNEDIGI